MQHKRRKKNLLFSVTRPTLNLSAKPKFFCTFWKTIITFQLPTLMNLDFMYFLFYPCKQQKNKT